MNEYSINLLVIDTLSKLYWSFVRTRFVYSIIYIHIREEILCSSLLLPILCAVLVRSVWCLIRLRIGCAPSVNNAEEKKQKLFDIYIYYLVFVVVDVTPAVAATVVMSQPL